MEQDFIKKRLLSKHKIQTLIPDEPQREIIHNIIYKELVLGNADKHYLKSN